VSVLTLDRSRTWVDPFGLLTGCTRVHMSLIITRTGLRHKWRRAGKWADYARFMVNKQTAAVRLYRRGRRRMAGAAADKLKNSPVTVGHRGNDLPPYCPKVPAGPSPRHTGPV